MIVRPEGSPVAIVHDYLTQRGGAERVVLAMCRAFPDAPVVTSLLDRCGTFDDFCSRDIRTSFLQRLPLVARHHRLGLPLYAVAFGRITVDVPLVVCSTAGWAHGIRTTGTKALYVHNTARWLYQSGEYLQGSLSRARPLLSLASPPLRRWDRKVARTAAKVWVTSKVVQERVRHHWSMDSEILPPPHGIDPTAATEPVDGIEPGCLLAVARLIHWKRVDVLVEAMRELPDQTLVVVGEGPEQDALARSAPANCHFLGSVGQPELRWLYANCAGLVSASHEDFGLTPLEAMAFGKPVAVLRRGGFLETVQEGETGVYFDEQDPKAVVGAVRLLLSGDWDSAAIAAWAHRFSEAAFISRFRSEVEALVA